MEKIKLSDFQIIPIMSSARREDISDQIYFSKPYTHYISNSRLGYINPDQGGSAYKYYNPPHFTTSSLALGSAVHELILQPESFTLGPKCSKPTAKLGEVIDKVKKYRKKGYTIYDSILNASKDCSYYVGSIDTKISKIIREGFQYYWTSKDFDDSIVTINDKDWDACVKCVENVNNNLAIQNALHPTNLFTEHIPSYNEDALFLDVLVTYKGKYTILKLKMKADNWTIDEENKILTLNDLKTTSKPVRWFMNREYGSFYHYHYYRQFALYIYMLAAYCQKEYGYNHHWKLQGNVLVVNTVNYETACYRVTNEHLKEGKAEYEKLLKMVAYYELFGYKNDVEFSE